MKRWVCMVLAVLLMLPMAVPIYALEEGRYDTEESAFLLGDVNGDGKINMIDAFQLFTRVSKGLSCDDILMVADCNQDERINMIDAFKVYNSLSKGM